MDSNYTITITVDASPEQVFEAINNPRGWWSQEIDGDTDKLNAVFDYHYQDVHRAKFKITEFEENKKVVWHVLDNHFNFVKDKTEWIDTDIVYEIIPNADQTDLRFTHVGLIPQYECYDVCTNAWGSYITESLRNLIINGEGQPNPLEDVVDQAREMSGKDYSITLAFDQSPTEVYTAINNVRGWWSDNVEGSTNIPGAEFIFRSGDDHLSVQKITELSPNEKVVWHITDSLINFVEDKTEWTDTDIIFDISVNDDKTELQFTHRGLVPAVECFEACSDAWGFFIKGSLASLITTGEGKPLVKEPAE